MHLTSNETKWTINVNNVTDEIMEFHVLFRFGAIRAQARSDTFFTINDTDGMLAVLRTFDIA